MLRSVILKAIRGRATPAVAYATVESEPKSAKFDENRLSKPYLDEILDSLWKCRRGNSASKNKLALFDAPELIMRHKAWSAFMEDGLHSVWLEQMIRKDVLAYMKPETRLTKLLLSMAKLYSAARDIDKDRNDAKSPMMPGFAIFSKDMGLLNQLINEMIHIVFARRLGTFRDIAMATDALGRFADLLNVPQDTVDVWSNSVNEWLKSGRLQVELSSGKKMGLTSLTSFLRGMAAMRYKPSVEVMRTCAIVYPPISSNAPDHVITPKSIMDYCRAWHSWEVNPESLCQGSWAAWWKGLEICMQRPKSRIGDFKSATRLIACAYLVAKDFDQSNQLKLIQPRIESTVKDILESGYMNKSSARNILNGIEKLNMNRNDDAIEFSSQIMTELKAIAKI